jgi:intracellular septation protein A
MNTQKKEKQENLLVNLSFNIIIPALILSKLAKYVPLEPYQVLILALLFPVGYAAYDFYERKKINAISVLGFVSILLTGVIGLFEFSAKWIAVKEAAVPFVIGLAVLISTKTKYPLVKTFIYNDKLLDVQRINTILEEKGKKEKLDKMLNLSSIFLAMSFFISAILNFVLAKIIIQSPTGTPEFNEELGKMIGLSYPVIALPCTIIMIGILIYVMLSIKKYSGLTMDEMYSPEIREKAEKK